MLAGIGSSISKALGFRRLEWALLPTADCGSGPRKRHRAQVICCCDTDAMLGATTCEELPPNRMQDQLTFLHFTHMAYKMVCDERFCPCRSEIGGMYVLDS